MKDVEYVALQNKQREVTKNIFNIQEKSAKSNTFKEIFKRKS